MNTSDWVQLAVYVGSLGVAFGFLKAGQLQNGRDITSIKKALGLENGHPPAFVRREQYDDAVRGLEADLADLRNRLIRPR